MQFSFFIPNWLFPCNTIPFHIYSRCSWFSEFHSEQLTKIFSLRNFQWYWANNIFMSSQLLFLGNWQYLKHSQEQVCLRLAYSVYYRILSVNYLISIENEYEAISVTDFDQFVIEQHNIKKIRNNIEKSNKSGKPRCLQIHGKEITWTQFKSAFNWDQKTFSLSLHEKLTMQHFDLDSASKMWNRLAEDVLDTKMLFLMQVIVLFTYS